MTGPITWVKRLFGPRPPTPQPQASDPYSIVLLGFEYDELTNETVKWLKELNPPQSVSSEDVYRIHDSAIGRKQLSHILNDLKTIRRLEVFCGHGDYDALLGPPEGLSSDISIGDTAHSVVYDRQMIRSNHGSMFAFCCRAGGSFGRTFGAFEGKAFLGFKEDLPIHLKNYFFGALKTIFQAVAREVLRDGKVLASHEYLLRRLYDQAIEKFLDDTDCEHRFLVRLYLEEHKSQIKRFGDLA